MAEPQSRSLPRGLDAAGGPTLPTLRGTLLFLLQGCRGRAPAPGGAPRVTHEATAGVKGHICCSRTPTSWPEMPPLPHRAECGGVLQGGGKASSARAWSERPQHRLLQGQG